ncbi:MAG: YkgJ family cysteine cluster protein [Pyrinomonadaceae bacterium]
MSDKLFEKLKNLYREVDSLANELSEFHAERLKCQKGCSACCVDGIAVFGIEAENIRRKHRDLVGEKKPHPAGFCAFLDQAGGCRIYPDRPYVCRTQGLPLRWFEEIEREWIELRDICPLNEEGEPLEELPADKCWTIGEFEGRLAELQKRFGRGALEREKLRDLFA